MQISHSTSSRKVTSVITLSLTLYLLHGCTPTEIQAVTSDISGALTDLEGNKALAEECVKEVKTTMVPADPQYQSIMEAYEQAREGYNHYLSQVETAARIGEEPAISSEAVEGVKSSTIDFIADASRGLDFNVRGLKLNRAIVLPPKLSRSLKQLPNAARTAIADRVANDLRWKSWSQL